VTDDLPNKDRRDSYYPDKSLTQIKHIRDVMRATIDATLETLQPVLVKAAADNGYAFATHGSRARDLDVLLVPWTDYAYMPSQVIEDILKKCKQHTGHAFMSAALTEKPHGRSAAIISLRHFVLDISVMPTYHENGIFCGDRVIPWEKPNADT